MNTASDFHPRAPRTSYRLELLPVVPPYFRQARAHAPRTGELVYYGPSPTFYGIGEILEVADRYVVVDFRGTGLFGIHQETLERQYILPIPDDRRGLL